MLCSPHPLCCPYAFPAGMRETFAPLRKGALSFEEPAFEESSTSHSWLATAMCSFSALWGVKVGRYRWLVQLIFVPYDRTRSPYLLSGYGHESGHPSIFVGLSLIAKARGNWDCGRGHLSSSQGGADTANLINKRIDAHFRTCV